MSGFDAGAPLRGLVSRSLLGAVVLNNLMAVVGFVKNRIDLPGTPPAGWLQAALACVLFVVVFRVMRRRTLS